MNCENNTSTIKEVQSVWSAEKSYDVAFNKVYLEVKDKIECAAKRGEVYVTVRGTPILKDLISFLQGNKKYEVTFDEENGVMTISWAKANKSKE